MFLELVGKMIDYHHLLDDYYKPFSAYSDLENEISEWLKDKNMSIFVAEDNGKLIAYLRSSVEKAPTYSAAKKIGLIDDVFVEEVYRRQKIGTALFDEALNWFKIKNVKNIELNVDARNQPAIKLWKKFGFNEYKLRLRMDL